MSFLLICLLYLLCFYIVLSGLAGVYFCLSSGFFRAAPPVPSNSAVRGRMLKDIESCLNRAPRQVVMDLGSGWGSCLVPLARKYPGHLFIGVEKAFLPYFYAKIRGRNCKNLTFKREDLFLSDISKADIVILYLIGHLMPRVTRKCRREMKKNALVYSNHFPLALIKPLKTVSCGTKFDRYFVYKM